VLLLNFADHESQSDFAGLKKSQRAKKPQGEEWFAHGAVKGEKKKSRQIANALEPFLPTEGEDTEMATEPTAEDIGVVSPRSSTDLQETDTDKKPSAKDQADPENQGAPEDNVAAEMSASVAPNSEDATAATTTSVEAATVDETTDADMGDSAAAIANEAVQSAGDDGEKNITKRRRVEK
jgi:hypothetical protein